jgi:lysyl-tRNA synthetase, class II
MPEYTSLEKIRLEKIEELRAEGIEPYPTRAERTHTSAQAIAEYEAAEKQAREGETPEVKATLAGRIRASRPMGKLTFTHIEDGAGRIQLFFRVNELGQDKIDFFNEMFDLGDFIQATGVMMRTRTGEATLLVHDFKLLAKSVTPLPAARMKRSKTAPWSATRAGRPGTARPPALRRPGGQPRCARNLPQTRGAHQGLAEIP